MKAKIYKYLSYLKRIIPYFYIFLPIYIKTLFKNKTKDDIWLISERGDEARDNGYHLFKYIRTYYPEIKVYFVIDTKSSDYNKVSNYGNIIELQSKEHFEKFIYSNKLISTHMYGAAPYGKACKPFLLMMKKKVHVNLKHGMTFNNFKLNEKNIDLLICGSEREKNSYERSNEKVKKSLQALGLCRFDNLKDQSTKNERIILIMPTFRRWLEDLSRIPNSINLFKQDDYYLYWKKLLESKKLQLLLEEENVKIIFYPHYRSQKYLQEFKVKNKNIVYANKKEYDIQSLLKKSSLLITDYSSVHFDFAYMTKPVIYYQFDSDKFYKTQYKLKYTFEEAGLGPVTYNVEQIENEIIKVVKNNFIMANNYKERLKETFKYQDDKNTKRNFLAIKNLK